MTHCTAMRRQVSEEFSVIGLLKPVTSSDLVRCFMLIWCPFGETFAKKQLTGALPAQTCRIAHARSAMSISALVRRSGAQELRKLQLSLVKRLASTFVSQHITAFTR